MIRRAWHHCRAVWGMHWLLFPTLQDNLILLGWVLLGCAVGIALYLAIRFSLDALHPGWGVWAPAWFILWQVSATGWYWRHCIAARFYAWLLPIGDEITFGIDHWLAVLDLGKQLKTPLRDRVPRRRAEGTLAQQWREWRGR